MSRRHVFWMITAVAVLAAAWQAWALRWTCDDAFISFRYALHFAEGHGLVFNLDASERPVEGYTNFLWTVWLAVPLWLGASDAALEMWAIVSGVACHAGTVWLLASLAWRTSEGRALVPIAACSYAAIHHAASLAPAGLETALFVLLVTLMLRSCCGLLTVRAAWWLGGLGVLAAMTRPDGAIPVVMAGLFVLFDASRQRDWRLLVGYVTPFLVVFVPYLLWRHNYYGYWVPNTFFAKSGEGSYLAQGIPYVVDFFVCYWPLLLAFVPLAVFAGGRRPLLAIAALVLPYLAFVVWVGGDFMFGRFVLPVLPALLLALDVGCQRWQPKWLQPGLTVVMVVGLVFRIEPKGLGNPLLDVSDNRVITMCDFAPGMTWAEAFRLCGEYLRPVFAGLDVRLGIAGGHANLAYRSRAPVAIECAAGLTDAFIARIQVPPGGKRGHDRPYTLYPDYLVQRRVHFMLDTSFGAGDPWRRIFFKSVGLPMQLVTWDRALMRELLRRDANIEVTDFEQFLDGYIRELPQKSKDQVRADFAKFRSFYFDHEDDAARRQVFEQFLQ